MLNKLKIGLSAGLLSINFLMTNAQVPAPAPPQHEPLLVINATIHTGTGEVLQNGWMLSDSGKIKSLGTGAPPPTSGKTLDASNQQVYPGFIMPNSILGLNEIEAIRPTHDYAEAGKFNGNARAIIAYNTESELTPTIRFNGILLAQIMPKGGYITGSSAIVQLDAWNWQDAAIHADEGISVVWPAKYQRTGWWAEPGGVKKDEKRDEVLGEIKRFFQDAKSYHELGGKAPHNLNFEAARTLFTGEKTLYIQANGVSEMMESVLWFKSIGMRRLVLVGGKESWRITDFLKQHNIPVILQVIHDLPSNADDDIDQVYKTPYLLYQAGILFCLAVDGPHELMRTRNLPFMAGTAIAYGLPPAEALKAISAHTARILGIDKSYGTLEPGKSATFFISKGDALDMLGNHLTRAFIDGREITLPSKQQTLYRKYMQKYGLEE